MVISFLRLLFFLGLCGWVFYVLRRFLKMRSPLPNGEQSDPYIVLGISRTASKSEIKDAYHRELAKYHPDKVAHLGEDLQALASVKTAAIIAAYDAVK